MAEYIISDEQIAENQRLHGKMLLMMPVVVRCRDCKYGNGGEIDKGHFKGCCFCTMVGRYVVADGYCAWGERRG